MRRFTFDLLRFDDAVFYTAGRGEVPRRVMVARRHLEGNCAPLLVAKVVRTGDWP
jgi:hypothetical protein